MKYKALELEQEKRHRSSMKSRKRVRAKQLQQTVDKKQDDSSTTQRSVQREHRKTFFSLAAPQCVLTRGFSALNNFELFPLLLHFFVLSPAPPPPPRSARQCTQKNKTQQQRERECTLNCTLNLHDECVHKRTRNKYFGDIKLPLAAVGFCLPTLRASAPHTFKYSSLCCCCLLLFFYVVQ